MNRGALEDELLDWIREPTWRFDDKRFEAIALELFRIQFESCEPYALFCRSLSRTPESVARLGDIPAVPTGSFKEFDLRCFDPEETVQTFRTSGTSTDRRGALHLDRVDLYEASLLSSLRRGLMTGWASGEACLRILAPDVKESPESSLSYMFSALVAADGGPGSGFDVVDGQLEVDSLRRAIAAARQRDQPMLVAGTAFAFVHLLDAPASGADDFKLPSGSRVMETGGFKGRSREIPRDVLHASLASHFDIPLNQVVNQYGMTELGSQFYDSTLIDPDGPRRKLMPPWARVRIVDPETQQDVEPGEVGLILIHDLANTGSVAALLTADLGRRVLRVADADERSPHQNPRVANKVNAAAGADGFDVLGRAEGAEARGCSIAADAMLEAAGSFRR